MWRLPSGRKQACSESAPCLIESWISRAPVIPTMANILRSVMFLGVRELLPPDARKAGKVSEGVSAARHVTDRLGRHVLIRRKSSFRGDDKRGEDCRGYPARASRSETFERSSLMVGMRSSPSLISSQKDGGSETPCQSLSMHSVACQSKQRSPVSALPSPSDGCSFALNRGPQSWAVR
jgi:hypothetical protein